MTRRRRSARLGRFDPEEFLYSDGWHEVIFDDTPLLPSLAEAAAAWERCRERTWQLWVDQLQGRTEPWPFAPVGARCHDGICGGASVAEFRRRHPQAARSIADELDIFLAELSRPPFDVLAIASHPTTDDDDGDAWTDD